MEESVRVQSASISSSKKPEIPAEKSQKIPILVGILILLISTFVGWYFLTSQNKPTPSKEPEIAATVNGEKIFRSTYQSLYNAQKYYFENIYTTQLKQPIPTKLIDILPNTILDNLIEETLLAQYLAKKNIRITNADTKDAIQKQVVDPTWKGEWPLYEDDLRKTHTTLENIMHSFRTGLMIRKAVETETIQPADFANWYDKLRKNADIKIYLKEYKS